MTHPNIRPVGAGDWVRFMLFTHPGWGKTSLIGTAAEAGMRTLIVRSSMDQIPARIINQKGIDEYVADTHEAMQEILDYCRMSDDFPYAWVWWDCISIAQDILLDDVWYGTLAEKPARGYIIDKTTGKPGKLNMSPSSGLDRGEYWRNAERIQQWVRHMVGCKRFHFGITAHPSEGPHPADDMGGSLLVPWIQVKNMPSKICGYMNVVGFLDLKTNDDGDKRWRRLHFQENNRFYAKDLYDAFPKGYLDEPTVPKIMDAIEKARGRRLGHQTQTNGKRGASRKATGVRRGRRAAA